MAHEISRKLHLYIIIIVYILYGYIRTDGNHCIPYFHYIVLAVNNLILINITCCVVYCWTWLAFFNNLELKMVRIFMREARKDNGFSYIYAYKTYSLLELKRIRSSKKELKKIHIGRM